ncbi:unnamed protein product [Meganyctiphanes norvegica]|uniref:Uncharacterized protein n=1 Tax=Meganyctiphanes norvegica TaxID=48144 RepID=A0AAV2QWR6_MEGNR
MDTRMEVVVHPTTTITTTTVEDTTTARMGPNTAITVTTTITTMVGAIMRHREDITTIKEEATRRDTMTTIIVAITLQGEGINHTQEAVKRGGRVEEELGEGVDGTRAHLR